MNSVINWFKKINLGRIITVFLSATIIFVTTACNGGAQAKTADQVREDVPTGALTNEYKGGMNDYSDTDPRRDTSAVPAKAKSLIDNAERHVIDETDDVGTNTKRILDKKGENAKQFGDNVKQNADAVGDKAQKSASDFARGTKQGIENIKGNTQDSTKDLGKGTQRAADNIQQNTKDAGRNVVESAKRAADRAADAID